MFGVRGGWVVELRLGWLENPLSNLQKGGAVVHKYIVFVSCAKEAIQLARQGGSACRWSKVVEKQLHG